MKKTYIIPTLNVVKMQTEVMNIPMSGQYNDEQIQSRRARFSEWDEDYDFEEE